MTLLIESDPPNDVPNTQGEYLVRDIIDVRPASSHYLVRWVGYATPTWEPLGCLTHCREALNDFVRQSRHLTNISKFRQFEEAMRQFEERVKQTMPTVCVRNDVDFGVPPVEEVVYIGERMHYHRQVMAPRADFLVGCQPDCQCQGGTGRCECLAETNYQLPYDDDGCLHLTDRTAVYECNERCGCDPTRCKNRVVQGGVKQWLSIERLPDERGWGVFAVSAIPKGAFIDRYFGEMITTAEAEKRAKQGLGSYLFDLDYAVTNDDTAATKRTRKTRFVIDARCRGSLSRFINHSCEPNLSVVPVFVECQEASMHGVAFFAARDIEEGEQLCFDYTGGRQQVSGKRRPCLCGSVSCHKYIYL